jgi:hypothetical protein
MAYIGKQPVVGNFVKLDAITTSATATYNLLNGGVAYFPQTANNCIVSLNGVIQSPTSAYTISGSTIVFSDALTASDSIDFILVLGDVLSIGTPSDSTVGFSKVTSNLITGATAETSIADGDSVLIYDDSASALRKMTRTNFVSGLSVANTPAFFAYANTATNLTSSATTKLTLNAEIYDTNNAFDSTTNYRFTVPSGQAGKYFFTGAVRQDGWGADRFIVIIQKNGNDVAAMEVSSGNSNSQLAIVSSSLDLLVSDYIELACFHNNGTTRANLTNSLNTYLTAFKLIGV